MTSLRTDWTTEMAYLQKELLDHHKKGTQTTHTHPLTFSVIKPTMEADDAVGYGTGTVRYGTYVGRCLL